MYDCDNKKSVSGAVFNLIYDGGGGEGGDKSNLLFSCCSQTWGVVQNSARKPCFNLVSV